MKSTTAEKGWLWRMSRKPESQIVMLYLNVLKLGFLIHTYTW